MGKANLHVFFLLFLILSSFCESNDQLTQANSPSPVDMLISEGRVFALGFFSPTNSSKSLYLGIWYHNIPERTVVWVANRDSPISNHSSVKLTITNSSEMVLFDSEGRPVWKTANTATAGGADGAVEVLLDSGTRLLLSYKAQEVGRLVAWKGPDDPSSGDFSLGIDHSSNLQIFIWNGSLPYKRLDVVNEVSIYGGTYQSINTTSVVSEYLYYRGDELYFTYTVPDGSPYTHILLDYTGNLSLLSWNNTTLSRTVAYDTRSYCALYASCGPFGYCDCDTVAVPTTCRCPDGYELIDNLNLSTGCQRKGELRCRKENNFMTMTNMKVPDKFLHIRNKSFEQCADECSRNCSCVAYAYANFSSAGGTMGDSSRCLVWTRDLIDMGKASFFSENLYIRLVESPVQKKNSLLKMLLPIIACVLLVAFGTLVWTCKSRGKRRKKKVQKIMMLDYLSSMDEAGGKIEFPLIAFENIVAATDNFSNHNMLGQGGFGKVYKGMLEGTKEVSVKRLSNGSGQGTEEFRNEVVLIAKLQHKNLFFF